ncbi:thioredoxin domain-containing protein [Chitinophaga sp. GCM10012297]|uniref:Thioredoxin domain-containing protein n=1 Tax=Chitinophaga chungangae TaxID=2821488 RepID=A0ABS3YDD7_9BACT|nr:thioredoxin domain-containing protein [Chitinophaga chungangae]MBO9152671.1 thioredoxin domain-containing protein [Chitinophaga chungangae]
MANRLAKETSPYLLQHAHNPVDWYPWGEEAFRKAEAENKPILVSIGYAACHWCHVMERESFENEATAAIMNEHFVNIKIDREERPDIDHIYMDALQAIAGNGGWPLNMFLLPDRQPFYGGTYFPPKQAYNRPSWTEVLLAVSDAFKTKRKDLEEQAANLTQHLHQSNAFGVNAVDLGPGREQLFTQEQADAMVLALLGQADKEWGGFGRAPKFPQSFSIQYLLRHYRVSKNEAALQQALLSLGKMIDGGIYDQLGGGFARYSTDEKWLAPHFEKMLYDNALLVDTLCEAYQLTGNERYAKVVRHTLEFVKRELTSPEGAFYSALDADSEGVEGKFYVWGEEEIDSLLVEDSPAFKAYYNISRHGNWEDVNILWAPRPLEAVAKEQGIAPGELEALLERSRPKLMAAREKRVRPGLDDKILLGWNALMIHACCKAAAALNENVYLEMAEAAMDCILKNMRKPGAAPAFWHTYKEGSARYPAFLDDYANLVHALIALQETSGNLERVRMAAEVADFVIEQFSDENLRYFYYTASGQGDVIVRKKEIYDGAVPSGNAVMAHNLWHLSIVFDKNEWAERALAMTAGLVQTVTRYPTSFGVWAAMVLRLVQGTPELAVAGPAYLERMRELNGLYVPYKVLLGAGSDEKDMPLLQQRAKEGKTLVYLCRDYQCVKPVEYISEITNLI